MMNNKKDKDKFSKELLALFDKYKVPALCVFKVEDIGKGSSGFAELTDFALRATMSEKVIRWLILKMADRYKEIEKEREKHQEHLEQEEHEDIVDYHLSLLRKNGYKATKIKQGRGSA